MLAEYVGLAADSSPEDCLEPIYEAVVLMNRQLQWAIAVGDDALVDSLDRQLHSLTTAFLAHRAVTFSDLNRQIRFAIQMIEENADDRASVLRHLASLSGLIDRGVARDGLVSGGMASSQTGPIGAASIAIYENLSDVILNCLPEKVAVLTGDYR
ncbi:hypothetical protein FE840_014195 [Peteryoungia desertarenae]|uniref:Uncharacterized protein n=1 Tax=Peteryoungia desertarenae TaxID=1813451 RepID=A0ABX6QPV7_9HYPH|nr:hypothetical protein [Peteryoungia desertarenae]QLF70593.1 hypothetical protein FE840_014195 [Peteryoungia desertarenae]